MGRRRRTGWARFAIPTVQGALVPVWSLAKPSLTEETAARVWSENVKAAGSTRFVL